MIITESHKLWQLALLQSLKHNGLWYTSFAVFRKTGDLELTLVDRIEGEKINEEIEKIRLVMEAIGGKLKT